MAHLTTNPENPARWICLYPAYLDANLTLQEGRKISKENAVVSPTIKEIAEVLKKNNIEFKLEAKAYPRIPKDRTDFGRFRVQLKDSSGNPVNSKIPHRRDLQLFVASQIKLLEPRVQAAKAGLSAPQSSTSSQSSAGKPAPQQQQQSKKSKRGGKKGKKK